MKRVRLGVIGGGHLGRIHAKLASTNDQFELIAVADPSSAARQQIAEQLDASTVGDYHDLIGCIDAAVVAAPTINHYEITSTLLRAGVHTLVEKPLAATADQAQRLVQIARSHNRVLQVGHVERFNASWTAAQAHLGVPKFVEATRSGPYSGRSTDIGVVMDLMIHDLDLILSLDRSPLSRVQASGIALVGTHEDIAESRLEFASGLIATLRASRLSDQANRCMKLFTTAGYAEIDFSADDIKVIRPSEEIFNRAVALDELPPDQRLQAKQTISETLLRPQQVPVAKTNAILDEHHDFALSIHTGSIPAVSGEDGARAVEVATQIVQLLQRHRWDGQASKPWRLGINATLEPQILPLPHAGSKPAVAAAKVAESSENQQSQRRAG